MRFLPAFFILTVISTLCISCGKNNARPENTPVRTMYLNTGGNVNTLDPILADELMSQYMVSSFYDTLVQYDYTARPYKLIPSMLAKMPETDQAMTVYTFELRADLYFSDDRCYQGQDREKRKITSKDVIYSFLRLADARNRSPGFWILRNKVIGLDKFNELTAKAAPGDYSLYEKSCEGFEIISDSTFRIKLIKPDPRLLYSLAMPYASIVSRKAVEYYKIKFAENPVGSGPFTLQKWLRDYVIELARNPDYRTEFFPEAVNPADRTKKLPLLDKVVCYLVKQPISAWLMFLQGKIDASSLDKDHFDAVVNDRQELIPALRERNIKMLRIPEFQINYIGFSFTDPALAANLNLRKAISLAYDVNSRVRHFNYCIIPANSPIPPNVAGHDEKYLNPYAQYSIEKAKEYLKLAGYPGGIDLNTKKPLELTFDLMGNSSQHRQLAELMVSDMKKIGINIKPLLNNKPRFFQKAEKGQLQLFRLSWVGDYPDAENFLQLFYSKNAGSCNRTFYKDENFDELYMQTLTMPDSPERTRLYTELARLITEQCIWICESYPVSFQLMHSWLQNYQPHDFAFSRWKYLSIDTVGREKARKDFRPLEMQDLRKN